MAKREESAPEKAMPENTVKYTPRENRMVKMERPRKSPWILAGHAYTIAGATAGIAALVLEMLRK